MKIKIEVSARHIHLSKKDLEILFGEDYKLTPIRDLSQKGEFAAKEKIILKKGNSELKARIILNNNNEPYFYVFLKEENKGKFRK